MTHLNQWAEAERQRVNQQTAALKTYLPLKYLRQQAHYTTPASSLKLARSAAERGFAPAQKILANFNITLTDLASVLGVDATPLEALAANDPHAPLVMLDGEDAQALNDETVAQGRRNAVEVFREADWRSTLRFYRPSGISLDYCVGDLITVLSEAGRGRPPEAYPIDGIIFPKLEHPAEAEWVCTLLGRLEQQLGLPANKIKLQFLVESGWAAANLPAITQACLPRLVGIIFGIADYAADLSLPAIRYNHPVADWARAQIVNLAGAVGVPAIDAMTVNYPVADTALSAHQSRQHILGRLKECYDDAVHSIEMGMKGKWVGHPAQLLVTLLAFQLHFDTAEIERELNKIRAYQAAVAANIGATIINGVMSDRATDRHARARLREGVALGLIDAAEAAQLGIIEADELN